jgi:arginyl-tRNA synthetase
VEAVPPGFINFWLKPEALHGELKEILRKKNKYGQSSVKGKRSKMNLEFVSANPTGPLTMANGRGGFYGDVLANVLENAGRKVTREYYINDAGNQVFMLGLSILNKTAPEKVEEILKKYQLEEKAKLYAGAYVDELVGALGGPVRLSAQDPQKIGKRAAEYLLKDIKRSLKKAGIKFDVWFSEDKNLHKKKELKKTLEFLKKREKIEEKDGATWLGDGVLVKSDGNTTYFLADLAYHYDKFIKRKFDVAIDIWGADHHGYKSRMEKGVAALGMAPDRLKILIAQLVRLVSGGKEVRMSKRKGEFITMDELLDEVGVDAARFFFLMHSLDTHMDFDLDLAKEKSQKNPVYYAQYAYVRATNILRKSKVGGRVSNVGQLASDAEVKLMLELVKLPDVLAQTAEDYQVHRLTKYALELAKALHNFYEKERVVGIENKELEKARLALVSATKITLENLFTILGISKPKKM